MRVHAAMTRDVVTVSPETDLRDVAALLGKHGISGMPVVAADGVVVGVVSEADLLATTAGADGSGVLRRMALVRRVGTAAFRLSIASAGHAMSSPPVTIAPDRPLAEAARLMLDRGVNRLPVVDAGRLAGIVSRADLVRAFVRDDVELANEIRSEVVLRGIYVSPADVDVSVRGGIVALTGEVETRGKAERLVEFVERVPGVVSVTSEVRWRRDAKAPRGVKRS